MTENLVTVCSYLALWLKQFEQLFSILSEERTRGISMRYLESDGDIWLNINRKMVTITLSERLFYTSVPLLLSLIQDYYYHLPNTTFKLFSCTFFLWNSNYHMLNCLKYFHRSLSTFLSASSCIILLLFLVVH